MSICDGDRSASIVLIGYTLDVWRVDYSAPENTWKWWASKRLHFTIAVFIAGATAFSGYFCLFLISYDDMVDKALAAGEDTTGIEIHPLFTMVQGVLYCIWVGILNILYFVGPIFEKSIEPNKLIAYRKITYTLRLSS